MDSLKEARHRKSLQASHAPAVQAATEFKDKVGSWIQKVSDYDNQQQDLAGHKSGLVVLDDVLLERDLSYAPALTFVDPNSDSFG